MTCCIVGLLILSVVGRIRRLTGGASGRIEAPLFAPVARRPAPGQILMPPVNPPADEPPVPGRPSAPVLRYCALAIAVCLLGYPLLAVSGAVNHTGSPLMWSIRSGLYLTALVAAVALSRHTEIWRAPTGAGTLLVVGGTVVFELGMLDMHIFRLFAVDRSNILAIMALHNIGPVLAMAGGLVLLYAPTGRSRTSRRPSRSTVTSARPSSSAVTVSSTPPATT